VRSSTQERFRRDVLGVQPGPDALPAVAPGMVVVTPPAPDALTDLLAGYRATLQVADDLPPLLTVRAGDGTITRRVRVPRLRMFLRYFLNQHICRRLAHLKRAFHADAALGRDRSGELAAIDHFEQAVVPVPVRRIVIWFAVSVIFAAVALANLARALADEPLREASAALRGSISSVVSVDTNGLIEAAGKFDLASGAAAVIVITLSLYVISALPITSFRLKRMLLNLSPTDAQTLASTAALDHVTRADGVYRDEREAFEELEVPAPREIPFDLIAQATLMLPPLVLGVALAVANLDRIANRLEMDSLYTLFLLSAVAWACLVLPLGRLAHLASIWQRRVDDSEGVPPPQPFTRVELGSPARRLGAYIVDSLLGAVASIFVMIPLLGFDDNVRNTVWWFVGVPIAFALVTVPFMLRDGEHAGQTLGKQLLGLRVVCDSHGRVSGRRAAGRELLIKAPFWTGSVSLLFLPAIVNAGFTIFDPERRGIQDRATGTRVVRVP
jgi:uncharacterized RDD family membrane protein YckC